MISFGAVPEKILIAPLHWGLGHATRCIPLIQNQLDLGNEVTIAASDGPKALLQSRFPALEFIEIPFMVITYPNDGNMVRHFSRKGLRLLLSIIREHRLLQRMVKEHHFDVVISDSRFGLWTSKAKSVFITHQLEIQSPAFQAIVNWLNRWVMKRYDEVWVPDYPSSPGLAGKLSHPEKILPHVKYIGPLSRFNEAITPVSKDNNMPSQWEAVAIISGPEPQRSRFEADIVRRYIESEQPLLLLRGRPDQPEEQDIGKIKMVNHLEDQALIEALKNADFVIARSGYSTIMDLAVLGVKAELIPTPGQTEQEYLAALHEHGIEVPV